MKKYFIVFSLIVVLFLSGTIFTQAATLEENFVNYYFYRRGGGKSPQSGEFHEFSINGKTTYCVEPGVDITKGANYVEEGSSPFDAELTKKINLIGRYGYDYEGHQTLRYRMATQLLIWEAVGGQQNEIWDGPQGGGNIIDLSTERNAILDLVNKHDIKPSFDGAVKETIVGGNIIINDENHVVDEYRLVLTGSALVYIENNAINIKVGKVGEQEILLKRKASFGDETIFYYATGSQRQVYFGATDAVNSELYVKGIYGKVEINKTSLDGLPLEGVTFGVYNKNNKEVCQITTDANGHGECDTLEKGKYTVKELSPAPGYAESNAVYNFELNEEKITATLNIQNELIKGYIELYKIDKETKQRPQGEASFKGAQYGVYDIEDNLVATLTTDASGYAISEELPYGDYTIKEIQPSEGYLLDETVYHASITEAGEIVRVTSSEPVIKGYIEIYKKDYDTNSSYPQGDASLKGAIYGVYNSKEEKVTEIVTDENGYGKSTLLPYGNYTVKEIQPSEGYLLDKNIYHATVKKDKETIQITSLEPVIKGYIEIYKKDYDSNSSYPQGDASLKGAIYGVYNNKEEKVTEIVTNEKGYGKSILLPYGNYTVKEEASSTGYTLDKNIYSVSIKNNLETITITSKEKVIKHDFSLLKTMGDGTSGIIKTEPNAEFNIYLKRNHSYMGKITTDNKGKARITLPYGTYTVCQVKGSDYTNDAPCFDITVHYNDVEKVVNNEPLKAIVKVIKVDEETKKNIPLKGIKFKIKDLINNEYVCQKVTYPTLENVCEFTTNEDGILYTPSPLNGGLYELEEIDQAIDGYLWNKNPLVFEISKKSNLINTQDYGTILELEFSNKAVKGEVIVHKKGEKLNILADSYHFEEIDLDNITFALYANEDIYTKDGRLIYHKDEFINSYKTVNGSFKVSNLPLGSYYFQEIETLNSYVLDSEKHLFNLTYQDQYTEVVTEELNFKNYLEKGKLVLQKKNTQNELLSNAMIAIYKYNNEDESDAVLIYQDSTDENGTIILDNLPLGRYFLKEISAPEGYILNTETLYFDIKAHNDLIELSLINEPVKTEDFMVPDTYDNKSYIINLSLIITLIINLGIYAYEKKH